MSPWEKEGDGRDLRPSQKEETDDVMVEMIQKEDSKVPDSSTLVAVLVVLSVDSKEEEAYLHPHIPLALLSLTLVLSSSLETMGLALEEREVVLLAVIEVMKRLLIVSEVWVDGGDDQVIEKEVILIHLVVGDEQIAKRCVLGSKDEREHRATRRMMWMKIVTVTVTVTVILRLMVWEEVLALEEVKVWKGSEERLKEVEKKGAKVWMGSEERLMEVQKKEVEASLVMEEVRLEVKKRIVWKVLEEDLKVDLRMFETMNLMLMLLMMMMRGKDQEEDRKKERMKLKDWKKEWET